MELTMIEYELKEVKLKNNKTNYIPIFEDEDKRILTHFLSSECRNFFNDIVKCLNSVLTEQKAYVEFQGNSCLFSADKNNTTIECIIEGANVGNPITIKTKQLKTLIESYKIRIDFLKNEEKKGINTIEFAKMCKPYYLKYRDMFGYVPCRGDYVCNQKEYFNALKKAIQDKVELSELLTKKEYDYSNQNIRY